MLHFTFPTLGEGVLHFAFPTLGEGVLHLSFPALGDGVVHLADLGNGVVHLPACTVAPVEIAVLLLGRGGNLVGSLGPGLALDGLSQEGVWPIARSEAR